jgi:hypothetical protein
VDRGRVGQHALETWHGSWREVAVVGGLFAGVGWFAAHGGGTLEAVGVGAVVCLTDREVEAREFPSGRAGC